MFWQRPLAGKELPEPLRATDGLVAAAPPEDVFTQDTVTKRMPKILDSVMAKLPSKFQTPAVTEGVKKLQEEMRGGAQLKLLEGRSARVGAEAWNEHLADFLARGEGWHQAPWWLVENYMYKRLLEELDKCEAATSYDPFEPMKQEALQQSVEPLEASLQPLMALVSASADEARSALDAALLRSLWGNQADLSLSGGEVISLKGGALENLVSDQREVALDALQGTKQVIIVLDNHGLEVLCDLVLADALLQLTDAAVSLHVKDAPVFVSDVTAEDVPQVLEWLDTRCDLAKRLKKHLADGRLKVQAHSFYTSARAFWELPEDLAKDYHDAVVILKGDANYRRLLGDLHWPYDTDFTAYAQSFWKGAGLICLRTMKSGVALGVSEQQQSRAQAAQPEDWLTSGTFGQVLAWKA